MNAVQKHLQDLRCFISHYDEIHLTVLEQGRLMADSYFKTKDIQIVAENPYQLNLIVPIDKDSFKVFHISHEADVKIRYFDVTDQTTVTITDPNHLIRMII